MRQLHDTWMIRHAFEQRSRSRMLIAALHLPSCALLADIYFGFFVAVLLMWAGMAEQKLLILPAALIPLLFAVKALYQAMRSMYPIADSDAGLEDKYRRDFQYFRFRLFAQHLREQGITPERSKELSCILQAEADLAQAHPPAVSRSALAIQITLYIGLLAALGSVDKFWGQGYVPTMLSVLPMTMFITYQMLEAFPPRHYREKELALFLRWFEQSDTASQFTANTVQHQA